MQEIILEGINLSRAFTSGETKVAAVSDVSLQLSAGEFVGIVGPSGCGKSTLLNILGLIEEPDSGTLTIGAVLASQANQTIREGIRRRDIGYVFQAFNLLSTLSVVENVMLPLILTGQSEASAKERAIELLERLGLSHRLRALPATLSGGEMQRVAIARAVAHSPKLIVADEPTGNLDSAAGEMVLSLLQEIQGEGTPIIMATHSDVAMRRCSRVISMRDGRIVK